ncbi:MAG TPA: L,D-transpeptidase, partial [Psychrobacter sp.]|nr:L,D-transpeptidase [Psychrobacter sp.]
MTELKIIEKITPKIVINIAEQTLTLFVLDEEGNTTNYSFTISTAKNGIGSQEGSGCTPLGKH